jgi:hypothetical protein
MPGHWPAMHAHAMRTQSRRGRDSPARCTCTPPLIDGVMGLHRNKVSPQTHGHTLIALHAMQPVANNNNNTTKRHLRSHAACQANKRDLLKKKKPLLYHCHLSCRASIFFFAKLNRSVTDPQFALERGLSWLHKEA